MENSMKTLEESVVTAMDGVDSALFPYLPYILQDLWEIGTDTGVIIELVRKHCLNPSNLRVLDPGCGKGAVSIKLAKEFNCSCLGIDGIKEFIEDARKKATDLDVSHLCQFEVGDIRERVKDLSGFDIIILGAIGPVFGDYVSSLTKLSKCLKKEGKVIIDDGYIKNNSDFTHPLIQKQETVLQHIKDSGMRLIDEVIIEKDKVHDSNEYIFEKLEKRCHELIDKFPDKRKLFENYIKKQVEENEILEEIVCSTMVIQMK